MVMHVTPVTPVLWRWKQEADWDLLDATLKPTSVGDPVRGNKVGSEHPAYPSDRHMCLWLHSILWLACCGSPRTKT